MPPLRHLAGITLILLSFSTDGSLHADPSPPPPLVSHPPNHHHYEVVPHSELEALSQASRRIASMMDAILPFESTVWPHAIRDELGRTGIFLAPSIPFNTLATNPDEDPLKGWIVCAILATGKYIETIPFPVHHVCLTDQTGMRGELWCYDIDIATVRYLHRHLASGTLTAEQAYQTLIARWKKITRPTTLPKKSPNPVPIRSSPSSSSKRLHS